MTDAQSPRGSPSVVQRRGASYHFCTFVGALEKETSDLEDFLE